MIVFYQLRDFHLERACCYSSFKYYNKIHVNYAILVA